MLNVKGLSKKGWSWDLLFFDLQDDCLLSVIESFFFAIWRSRNIRTNGGKAILLFRDLHMVEKMFFCSVIFELQKTHSSVPWSLNGGEDWWWSSQKVIILKKFKKFWKFFWKILKKNFEKNYQKKIQNFFKKCLPYGQVTNHQWRKQKAKVSKEFGNAEKKIKKWFLDLILPKEDQVKTGQMYAALILVVFNMQKSYGYRWNAELIYLTMNTITWCFEIVYHWQNHKKQ